MAWNISNVIFGSLSISGNCFGQLRFLFLSIRNSWPILINVLIYLLSWKELRRKSLKMMMLPLIRIVVCIWSCLPSFSRRINKQRWLLPPPSSKNTSQNWMFWNLVWSERNLMSHQPKLLQFTRPVTWRILSRLAWITFWIRTLQWSTQALIVKVVTKQNVTREWRKLTNTLGDCLKAFQWTAWWWSSLAVRSKIRLRMELVLYVLISLWFKFPIL